MSNTTTRIREQVERFLPKVLKPSRYLGAEWNSIHKDWDETDVHMVFAFPDVYEVGMSHLGTRILYHLVNSFPWFACERVFAPWVDMEEKMRARGIPLYALESFRPIRDFDVLGFTLQYEMSFSNILNMLDLAGIPLRTSERGQEDPWVIVGGPCAYNPEPLAPFIDFALLGESEEQLPEVLNLVAEQKKNPVSRREFLLKVAQVQGVYVPEFYQVDYQEDGRIAGIIAEPGVPKVVEKAIVKDLDAAFFPTNPIVPYMEIVHDRMMLEVMRGCSRGCRFCQAGMIYRPVRERSPETLLRQTEELVRSTGYEEISLTSLSSGDYSCIQPVVQEIIAKYSPERVGVSLPSLRIDSFDVKLAQEVQKVRKSGLTFAPEAGTQRLRDVINKGVTEENLMEATEAAFKAGWSSIKLYFMIGLPTETQEDLDGIAHLAKNVANLGNKLGRRNVNVTVSTSSFVPKSHTPFQWEPQERQASLEAKQKYLKEKLRDRRIKYNYHDASTSFLEAVFAKGDRRLADVLEHAFRAGCRFDGWSEHFRYDVWMESFRELGIDPSFYAHRALDYDDVLAWDHLESGVKKRFLMQEHFQALQEARTLDCRLTDCTGCGVCPDRGVQIDLKG
ncbi:MAG: TIGR03960 family B12-binding radical SAM protein [Desulfitobacteriaceae bacterium]|nr:TIGR03960 family B12-binding radical SAM protein [Desulfitobacteriaceae bacterium]MDI6879217.1 TIGR03960 family B12-binding radical SAM protein [Desulfitobacteriaceae bacterium]MDI6914136.1 TIGR03960 family B12-binding radical SAM protein [Desulfitobacteriaceae bacterium]